MLSSLQLMQDYGVNLICVEDGIDSSKEAGKLLISIIAAVAEMERENIRVQTMAGREQKAREGKWNGGFAPYGYKLENGELVIAEDEVEIIQMIFDRYIHTNDGINGVANYLNNHGYTKKLRQNGTIPGFSSSFIKKIIDNPVYMGKIAYGRRRTEKKTGTRNETHVVEQSEFPVYEGIHEAIISEEDWNLAQEKRSKNNYRREKIHDPEHAHILSGILKCPCCGKGMYGNIAKAGRKDKKTRYYYYCKNTVNATGHKCTFRCNIEQSQIDDVLAKLITAMTREGKFKDAIQDRIGATVDTSDLEKQLSVLNANLHQAEIIKTRLEQQMDNLDVTDIHYDKKISDLQRRLDTQYDKIDEVEEAIADLKSQVYELKKNQIDADSIYGFLNAFNELYAECTDAEKKQFMQAFIERIDIFPERREDGNWIRNIKFQFPVPVLRDGKEVVQVDGISLDKEQSDEHTVTLEKFPTLETVVLLSQMKQKPDDYIDVTIELDNVDITSAETKATYDEIKKYVSEHNAGMKVPNLYISQVKRKCGIEVAKNLRVATRRMDCLQGNSTTAATDLELVPSPNLPKNEDSRQPQCPEDKERAIVEALEHFKMIQQE